METKKPLFSGSDLFKIAFPLILQQILAVTIGMVDTMMVSTGSSAQYSSSSVTSAENG